MPILTSRPFAWTLLLAPLLFAGRATEGVSRDRILLGQSCALEGPFAGLGMDMRDGLNTYFEHRNQLGGIHGRRIALRSVDDRYLPKLCVKATRQLIEEDEVFMLVGQVGTPTARVALPISEEAGVPFVAPLSGAGFLRTPLRENVINLRASYEQELARLTEYLIDEQGYSSIACLYQYDGYGKAGLEGLERALARRGVRLVAKASCKPKQRDVSQALAAIGSASPEAVVLIGAITPCAGFIKSAKRSMQLQDTIYCTLSFIDAEVLLEKLGPDSEGVIASQVVPYPWDTSVPVVAEFNAAMQAKGDEEGIGFVTLEGYLAGKFYCQVLESLEDKPTREAFVLAVEEIGEFDLGGVTLNFGPEDHQGLDEVHLTVFEGGEIRPLL